MVPFGKLAEQDVPQSMLGGLSPLVTVPVPVPPAVPTMSRRGSNEKVAVTDRAWLRVTVQSS